MAFTGWKLSGLATDELIPLVSPTGGTPTSVTQYVNDVALTTQSATQVGITGGLIKTGTPVAGGSSYNVLATDLVLMCSTSAAIAITLPTAASSQYRTIQVADVTGGAGSANISVSVSGGGTINGSASYVINANYGSATFVSTGATWVVVNKISAAGNGYATGVRQIVSSFQQSVVSATTQLPADNTIPQNTEGTQFITTTITPQSSTSTLLLVASIGAMTPSATSTITSALFRDSSTGAFAAGAVAISSGLTTFYALSASLSSGSTSSTTFKLRVGMNIAGTLFLNGYAGPTTYYGGVCQSGLTVIEVGA